MIEIIERSAEAIAGGQAVGADPAVLPDDIAATPGELGDFVA